MDGNFPVLAVISSVIGLLATGIFTLGIWILNRVSGEISQVAKDRKAKWGEADRILLDHESRLSFLEGKMNGPER